ncbi:MAG: hypothetical protein L7U72_16650 [Rubripirellula sp.]|nr:hypothetical protein [Rubripirellula sp.]
MFRIFSLAVISLLIAAPSAANNSYFIPGDAFFYCEIDLSEWNQLHSGQLNFLEYDRPEEMPVFFCGYTGYRKLDLSNLSTRFRSRLLTAVASMKKRYPSALLELDREENNFPDTSGIEKKELNKIRVFVYNKSFDYSKFRIGLKYNESWVDYATQRGFKREHFQYDFFVPTVKGITESWRMGSAVPPLNVNLHSSNQDAISTAMTIDASQVMFLICPPVSFESLCFPSRDSKLECYAVSESTLKTLINDQSKPRRSIWLEAD